MAKKKEKEIVKEIIVANFPHKYQEEIVIPHSLIPKQYWTYEYIQEKDMHWITLDGEKVRLKFLATNGDGYGGFEDIIERIYQYPANIIYDLYSKKYNVKCTWHWIKMEKI